MTQIEQKISDSKEIEFPAGLHKKIMRKVSFLKFRTPLILISLIILFSNLFVSGWYIWSKAVEVEAISVIGTSLEDFDFAFDSFANFWQVLAESIPLNTVIIFIVNLFVLIYLSRLDLKFNFKQIRVELS